MIIRVFRCTPKAGAAEELERLARDVSVPFVDSQPGLVARYTGRGPGDEMLMISVWQDLDALKNMTGEDWESEVIPDERISELIAESSVRNYEAI
jgi:heme-degrading monooxygenase HmoA